MKYEVMAERISLVVKKGSIVEVDSQQLEIAKDYLKPIKAEEPKKSKKAKEAE